jgi:hypothetical protein
MTTFTPQLLGQAENALRALLTRTLAGSGLGYHEWVLINGIAGSGAEADRAALTALAVDALKISPADVDAALDRARDHIAATPTTVRLTEHGRAWYADRTAAVRRDAAVLFHGLDPRDTEGASRVLTTITERANALLAQSVPPAAGPG